MSRLRVILAILLLIILVVIGIVLPSLWKSGKNTSEKQTDPASSNREGSTPTEEMSDLEYTGFEKLSSFFPDSVTADLKALFPVYLQNSGRTEIKSVTFLPDETTYPDNNTTELFFQLSDSTRLPVQYIGDLGVLLFGDEEAEFSTEQQSYEKLTDDSLPTVTTDQVETRQEGGYDDITSSQPAGSEVGQ